MYLTQEIPGIGGIIRERPEDFLVEEQPLFHPSGNGEHIFLFIQKKEMTTGDMVDFLAKHFRAPKQAIGVAGQKDKFAITRQHVSLHIPKKTIADFPMIQHPQVSVLWADRHNSKLRTGQLEGNRFSIKIRSVAPTSVLAVDKIVKKLVQHGVPNRFGPQRFGMTGANHIVGKHLVLAQAPEAIKALLAPYPGLGDQQTTARALFEQGKYAEAAAALKGWGAEKTVLMAISKNVKAAEAIRRIDARDLKMYLNAWQSAIFNDVLDRRIQAQTLGTLHDGDVAIKHANDAVFAVDEAVAQDPATAQRLAAWEISPSGPMWASGMLRAKGETDTSERTALEATGVTLEDLTLYAKRPLEGMAGERRPLRVRMKDPEFEGGVDEHGAFVRIAFDLPSGAFATSVLAEIMKPPPAPLSETPS